MRYEMTKKILAGSTLFGSLIGLGGLELQANVLDADPDKTQKIRFVEDDAQNYMVSKIYELKHQKANDLVPFVLGAIKRYAKNGSADRINYSYGKKQFISVNCPIPLMPYIDDMIEKLDRPSSLGVYGSGIEGTGIMRSVYTPQYRSSQQMVDLMVKAGISSNATEGANQDAVVAYDSATNLIYWKDSYNKDKDLKKYLAWLDRPVPQCTMTVQVYEVRESTLRDIGVDYLAWKNGPGLNLLDVGASFLEGSGLAESFGTYGFFAFAPAFDFSFIRILEQNGLARVANSVNLTVRSGQDANISFIPEYQNLTKDKKFASGIAISQNDNMSLKITTPVISVSGATSKDGLLGSTKEDFREQTAVVNFGYELKTKTVVERNNLGEELYDEASSSSIINSQSDIEQLLTRWVREESVEQTVGVPFLSEIPVLKYLFSTTTMNTERYFYFVTIKTELIHPDTEIAEISGRLMAIPELVNQD